MEGEAAVTIDQTAGDAYDAAFAAPDEPAEAPAAPTERARDDSGRFSKSIADEPIEAPAEEPGAPPAAPAVQWDEGLRRDAPDSWSPEARALWEQMPEQARLEVRRREHQGQESAQAAEFGRAFAKSLSPFYEHMRSIGVAPAQAAAELFGLERSLRTGTPEQKMQVLQGLAQSYGVTLGAEQAQPADARISALQQQLQQVTRSIDEQRTYQAQEAEKAALADINAFKVGKEHFETVKPEMARLLQAGIAGTLQDAYDRACWAHPEVREKLVAKQIQADKEKAAKAAEEAKKAAAVNLPKRGTQPVTKPVGTMKDTAGEVWDRTMGAA